MTLEKSIVDFVDEIEHLDAAPGALVLIIAPTAWGKTALINPIIETMASIRHRAGLEHSSHVVIIADDIRFGDDAEYADTLIVTKTGLG